jgi:NAD(P)-dependent dehydrogenase (short-subunit alcohol dehydrogenase family)
MTTENPTADDSPRVAVVTGASRGIGAATARRLAADGFRVVLAARSADSLAEEAAAITAAGGDAFVVPTDATDLGALDALLEATREWGGRLDVLVNNAFLIPKELTSGKPFWECPISNWDDMVGVGTRSAYVASWHAAKLMLPRKRGLIANVSSSGAREYAWHVAYGVGKCALDRFTADAAHELANHGVAVVSLWPGLVLTERLEGAAKAGIPGLDFSRAESPRFTGRAVAALAADADVLRWGGRALAARELADAYQFTDVDGSLPAGPLHERPKSAGIT